MKKQLSLFILMLTTMLASAEAVEIDSICYDLSANNKTAEVTYRKVSPWNQFGEIVPIGKETVYRPLIEEGKVWTYHYYNDMTGKSFDETRVIDGDTIIGGLTYKKIYDKIGGNYLYSLREEGKQVYIVYAHRETPVLLYDFSKDKGDIITLEVDEISGDVYELRVVDVDTIDINGAKFRRMRVMNREDEEISGWATVWIEGVGSEFLLETNYETVGNNYSLKSCQINGRTYTSQELLKKPNRLQIAYRPFVEEGKVWKLGAVNSGNPVQCVEYYYFYGDTIVGGKTCKRMMHQRYVNQDFAESNFISQSHSLSYVGAWYEENKKVYFCDATNNQFKLKYDFSIDANDTLQIDYFSYVIGPRKTGGISGFKGVYRDVWECRDEERNYRCAPWLEGVGGVYAPPTINNFNVELADPSWFLMSCTVGDEVIYLCEYEDGATSDAARKQRIDFTHTIKIKPKSRTARGAEAKSLYGEYNSQQLGINLNALDEAYQVSITDEAGKAVYEKTVNAGSIVGLNIDISAYAKGRYTVTVENSNESFTGQFETLATGICLTPAPSRSEGVIYNLQGQRINSLRKGLNIVDGRKVYVK